MSSCQSPFDIPILRNHRCQFVKLSPGGSNQDIRLTSGEVVVFVVAASVIILAKMDVPTPSDCVEEFDLTLLDSADSKALCADDRNTSGESVTFTFLCKNLGTPTRGGTRRTTSDDIPSSHAMPSGRDGENMDSTAQRSENGSTVVRVNGNVSGDGKPPQRNIASATRFVRNSDMNTIAKPTKQPPPYSAVDLSRKRPNTGEIDRPAKRPNLNTAEMTVRSFANKNCDQAPTPREMFYSLVTEPCLQIFHREYLLTHLFERLESKHSAAVRDLSEYYVNRAVHIETQRYYAILNVEPYQKRLLNDYFDRNLNVLMDHVESRLKNLNAANNASNQPASVIQGSGSANGTNDVPKSTGFSTSGGTVHVTNNMGSSNQATNVTHSSTQVSNSNQSTNNTDRGAAADVNVKRKSYAEQLRAAKMLDEWYQRNRDFPYPNERTSQYLALQCGLSVTQVNKWIANKRHRDPKNAKSDMNYTGTAFVAQSTTGHNVQWTTQNVNKTLAAMNATGQNCDENNTCPVTYSRQQSVYITCDTFVLRVAIFFSLKLACTNIPFYYAAIFNKTVPLSMHLFLWIYKWHHSWHSSSVIGA